MFGLPRDVLVNLKRVWRVPVVFAARNPASVPSFCRRHRRRPMDFKDRPLFVVVGCTGTGKTKLGVTLAKELDGEVVSADSIQVYRGLDVATNKATEEETDGIPHHMMGTVDWDHTCNVHDYRNEALKIIEDIHSRGKVPVVVGGTSYYIESIIYNNLVEGDDGEREGEGDDDDDDDYDDDDNYDDDEPTDAEADNRRTAFVPSADDFRAYAAFRNVNDAPTADTADGAGRMYADALADAVAFARTMPPFGRLSRKRYAHTFADARRRWPSSASAVRCETAALHAHGVRVLDAVAAGRDVERVRYEVSAADVAAGLLERYARVHVLGKLDGLLRTAAAGGPDVTAALRRMHAEVVRRTQRIALAVLVDHERLAVQLISPAALKAHAAYFDPAAAIQLHPHNTRKVFRIIQIHLKRGKRKSELLEEQRTRVNGSDVPVMALRFKEVHMMWLTCDAAVLNGRLEKRTDEMVERGLIDELCRFNNGLSNKTGADGGSGLDFTKGVLQCIGVKQFQRYLEMPDETRRTDDGREALEHALAAMKTATKKYARRQTRWINNRFLKPDGKQAVSVYRLDCTDLADWQRLSDRAVDVARVALARKPRGEHTLKPIDVAGRKPVTPVYGEYHCDGCSRLFSTDIQYNIHMGSKKHVKVMNKRKRKRQEATLRPYLDGDGEDESNSRKKSQEDAVSPAW